MKIRIKNEKGLIASATMECVITLDGLARLQEFLTSDKPTLALSEPRRTALETLVHDLARLPYGKTILRHDAFALEHDFAKRATDTHFNYDMGHGVLGPEAFKSNTASASGDYTAQPTPEGLGWTGAGALLKLAGSLRQELRALGVTVNEKSLKAGIRIESKSADWAIVTPASCDLLQAEAFAIYMVDRKGFLNDKGNAVPLAGARLFESGAAAARTIQSRGLRKAAVVRTTIKIEALEVDHSNTSDLGEMAEAFARRDTQRLEHSVPRAAMKPGGGTRL